MRTEHLFSKYSLQNVAASVFQFNEQVVPVASAEVCIRMLESAPSESSEPQVPVVAQVAGGCVEWAAPVANTRRNKDENMISLRSEMSIK
jgi:hypothetical protein